MLSQLIWQTIFYFQTNTSTFSVAIWKMTEIIWSVNYNLCKIINNSRQKKQQQQQKKTIKLNNYTL